MKKLIRKGVFETNSSSSHSISIADDTKQFIMDTLYPDQFGIVTISSDEFGWDWFKYNDALTKATYAAQQFKYDTYSLEILTEVIKEQTGANDVKFVDLDNGYVDHQSHGIVPNDKESLRNFIFNKNSWLFGGNDNSRENPTFYNVPEIRDGKMIIPVYKYELSVEGYNKTTKFMKNPTEEEILDGLESLLQGVYLYENGYFDDDDGIFATLHRNRKEVYVFSSWKKNINYEDKFIYFFKDAWEEAKKIFDHDPKNKDLVWSTEGYKKCREIEESLINYNDSPFVKKIKFNVKEI
jgi:hypothetical protein